MPPESGTPAREPPGTAPSTWPAYSQCARSRERCSGIVGNHSKELVATKYQSPTRTIDGSGAKPRITGLCSRVT
jgi:hypothetical protein